VSVSIKTLQQLTDALRLASEERRYMFALAGQPPPVIDAEKDPPRLLPPKGAADALYASPEMLEKEIGSRYSGRFVVGKDLDVY
jgi:hypothetical protein